MAGKSIGSLHATITANADKFVNEFKRADNEARRSSAAIDKEVEKLSRGVKRKFSIGDIGKDFLKGLGIGSGFQLANTAVEKFAGFWQQAAESAAIVARESERATTALLSGLEKRRTASQNITALEKEQADLQRRLAGAQQARTDTQLGFSSAFKGAGGLNPFTGFLDLAKVWSNVSGGLVGNQLASQDAERIKADLQEIANTIADAKARLKKETDDKAADEFKKLQRESAAMIEDLRKDIFGGREEAALRALDHKNELLLKGTRPDDPVSDAFLRRGLQVGGANAQETEAKKQTSLLEKLLKAVERANTAGAGGNVPAYNLV